MSSYTDSEIEAFAVRVGQECNTLHEEIDAIETSAAEAVGIDDSTASTLTTYSSSKIEDLVADASGTSPDGITIVSDGALTAQDIAIDGDTSDLASDRGLFDMVNPGYVDYDTLTRQGWYYGYQNSSTGVSNGPDFICRLQVLATSGGSAITQIAYAVDGTRIASRYSSDGGTTWTSWYMLTGSHSASVNVYVSVNGEDTNLGTLSTYPVATINRALEIMTASIPSGSARYGRLLVGEGDWGSLTLSNLPFNLYIDAYSGSLSEYTEEMPRFTSISAEGAFVRLRGVQADTLLAYYGGCIVLENYNRFASLQANYGGDIVINASTSTKLELMAPVNFSSVPAGLYAHRGGRILCANSRTLSIAEDYSPTTALVYGAYGGEFSLKGLTIETADDVTFTGRGYFLLSGTAVRGVDKDWLDALPNSSTNGVATGVIINGIPWGGGSETAYLNGAGAWTTVAADSATNDGDGNEITSTYATTTALSEAVEAINPVETASAEETAISLSVANGGTYVLDLSALLESVTVTMTADGAAKVTVLLSNLGSLGAANGSVTFDNTTFVGDALTLDGQDAVLCEFVTTDGETWYGCVLGQ